MPSAFPVLTPFDRISLCTLHEARHVCDSLNPCLGMPSTAFSGAVIAQGHAAGGGAGAFCIDLTGTVRADILFTAAGFHLAQARVRLQRLEKEEVSQQMGSEHVLVANPVRLQPRHDSASRQSCDHDGRPSQCHLGQIDHTGL